LRVKDINLKLITHRSSVCFCRMNAVLSSWVWVQVSGQLYLYICRYNPLGAEANESFIFIGAHVPFFLLRRPVSCTAATGCQGFHRMNYLEANPLCQWGIENKLQPFQSGNKSSVSGHGVTQRSAILPTSVCSRPSPI